MLRQARCNNVVCCVPDRPALLENFGIKYCQVPLSDSPGASTELRQAIDTACGFIEDARSRGEGVVVHCNVGMSRSASVVIGYLIMSQRWSYERAYVHTKMIRGCILPNAGFEVVLAEMGEEICPARVMPSPVVVPGWVGMTLGEVGVDPTASLQMLSDQSAQLARLGETTAATFTAMGS